MKLLENALITFAFLLKGYEECVLIIVLIDRLTDKLEWLMMLILVCCINLLAGKSLHFEGWFWSFSY